MASRRAVELVLAEFLALKDFTKHLAEAAADRLIGLGNGHGLSAASAHSLGDRYPIHEVSPSTDAIERLAPLAVHVLV